VRALKDAPAFPDVDPTQPHLVMLAWSAGPLLVLLASGRRANRTGSARIAS
jgi:hypothetical protein